MAFKDGNGSDSAWVEQYQIHIHIHEDSMCPFTKKIHGRKIMPMSKPDEYPLAMDIHWVLSIRIHKA